MSEPFSPTMSTDGIDPILAAFQFALDQARTKAEIEAIVTRMVAQHPERAAEFHMMAETYQSLLGLKHPERLGPYRIRRVLAEGGMGTIYLAEEEELASDRLVAVKTVKFGRHADPDWLYRFEGERRALAHLHHTHIVSLFATGQEGDLLYFAMPFIQGVTLRGLIRTAYEIGSSPTISTFEDLVKEASDDEANENSTRAARSLVPEDAEQPQPVREGRSGMTLLPQDYPAKVALLMSEVADAVQHAHEAGIIHRDLKPSNIMVEHHGHSWLIDFGLAAHRDGDASVVPLGPSLPEGARDCLTAAPARRAVV